MVRPVALVRHGRVLLRLSPHGRLGDHGIGVGPGTMFGNWFAIAIGFLAMARVLYGNFALPKPTAVPL